jgi:hypothetical protein
MGLVCEALKSVGLGDKDFLLPMSQRYRRMMSQQASERMLILNSPAGKSKRGKGNKMNKKKEMELCHLSKAGCW